MRAPVLTVNAGSTSTKLAVLDGDDVEWSCTVASGDITTALADAGDAITRVVAVGHRVVHGGRDFVEPVRIDDRVVAAIESLSEVAPLHNRAALDGIAAARSAVPDVPHVACFDTAFHAHLPPAARTYGGPYSWVEAGLRRYGFHGLSHEYVAGRVTQLLGVEPASLRLVSCHLGGGCSLAAIAGGESVDTTMGFTPLDGLVMATRSGSVDPGILLYLLRHGCTADELDGMLERDSGLLGLSGVSADLREVLAARDRGIDRARLAVDVFVHRLSAGIGSMTAALGGADAVAFTGGIGEHSPEIRARALAPFAWVGALIDEAANTGADGDTDVSARGAPIRVLVIRSREDVMIARATRAVVGAENDR